MQSVLIVENNDFFRRSFKEILKKSPKNTGWTTSFLKTLLRALKSLQW